MSKNSVFIEQMTNMLIRPSRDIYPSDQLGICILIKVPNNLLSRKSRLHPTLSNTIRKYKEKISLSFVKVFPFNCLTFLPYIINPKNKKAVPLFSASFISTQTVGLELKVL